MRNPDNIREVSRLNPDYLGLIFYPKSKRNVSDLNANEIKKAIPTGILKVGVFVNEVVPEIIRKINIFELDMVQIHGDESPLYCRELKEIGLKVIKSFGVDKNFDFNTLVEYEPYCDYFLFDTKSLNYGGTGSKFDWKLLKNYSYNKPIFLSGGIGPEDADNILKINNLNIHAIDINSKFEKEPAVKNIDLLSMFFHRLKDI